MILEAGIDAIRKKSLGMTEYFMSLVDERLSKYGVRILTPRQPHKRGGHVTLLHSASDEITEFLDSGSVVTDKLKASVKAKLAQNTEPTGKNQIRISFSPLFMSYEDVWQTADNLRKLLIS